MRTIMAIGLTLCWLLASVPAQAKIYKWVDEKDRVHFTNDPTKVPKSKDAEVETFEEFTAPVKEQKLPQSSTENPIEKSKRYQDEKTDDFANKESIEKENQEYERRQESYQKLLQKSEQSRAQRIKKNNQLKKLDHKPESWTNEESLEEIIEGLQEGVKRSDQEIKKYKEKLEPPVIED